MQLRYVVGFVPEKGVMLRSNRWEHLLTGYDYDKYERGISHGLQAVSQHSRRCVVGNVSGMS